MKLTDLKGARESLITLKAQLTMLTTCMLSETITLLEYYESYNELNLYTYKISAKLIDQVQ